MIEINNFIRKYYIAFIMSFNQFIDRKYLITNPFNPEYNVNDKANKKVDWFHFKNYSIENPNYQYYIDYQPDRKMVHGGFTVEEPEQKTNN